MTSRHNLPNRGGSGRYRGGAREDGPMNTLIDVFAHAAPHWHERLAGRALSLSTGIADELAVHIIETINARLADGWGEVDVRRALNPVRVPFGKRAAGEVSRDEWDWLREELA